MTAVLQYGALLLAVLVIASAGASAVAAAIVPVCLLHDWRKRRREAAERLALLRATQPATPDPLAAGRARLDAALTERPHE